MARHASGGSVRHVVPSAALADGHDVVSVHRSPVIDSSAVNALPVAGIEYGSPPSLVRLIAVPTCRSIRAARVVPPGGRSQPHGTMGRDALWHQLLNITTPVTPVNAVDADTILRNSTPNASSGR